ncbi:MAG TPA: Crp/Fnr family transcriptional regulator [Actinocrinis sp.]|nr:Crp/Fnr family transcriptional regulator [Actinocrinis sp.]
MTVVRDLTPAPPAAPRRRWPQGTLLDALEPQDRAALLLQGGRRVFEPGEPLITEGDTATDVFLLLDGCAKVIGHSVDGRAVLLSIRVGGDVVGELAALDNRPRLASVVAATRVSARASGQRQFLAFLDARPEAERAVSRSIATKMRSITRHRVDVSGASVLVRLARVLDHLVESYSTPCPEGMRIDVPLSQPELAALIGAAEPSLHRALAVLRARGVLVTKYRRQIVRDRALLEQISRDPTAF